MSTEPFETDLREPKVSQLLLGEKPGARAQLSGRTLYNLIKLARPEHWVKSVFILLPVPFGVAAGAHLDVGSFLLGLFGMCLVSSAVYVVNDVLDAASDRLHTQKRKRPVASGELAPALAMVESLVLMGAGLICCWLADRPKVLLLVVTYGIINLAYCWRAKRVALLDVFLIGSGFVIRVMLGCSLLGVPPSHWLLLCSSALALFLGFAKRRADLTGGLTAEHRPSLAGYSCQFLDQMLAITATLTVLGYCLYSLDSPVFLKERQMTSVPFVAYAVFHYLRCVQICGSGASPVAMLYRSRVIQACGVCWLVAVTWSMGMW
jgi:4-hydroxybenzoate polyprenyltransferase